jgi:hypothetical protein
MSGEKNKDELSPSITWEEIDRRIQEGAKSNADKYAEYAQARAARKARGDKPPTDGFWWPVEGFEDEIKQRMDAHVRNLEALKESALFATIPEDVQERIRDGRVTQVGFGAGPGFVASRIHDYPEPVHVAEALAWLATYQTIFKRAHMKFEDGFKVYFDPNRFEFAREAADGS